MLLYFPEHLPHHVELMGQVGNGTGLLAQLSSWLAWLAHTHYFSRQIVPAIGQVRW